MNIGDELNTNGSQNRAAANTRWNEIWKEKNHREKEKEREEKRKKIENQMATITTLLDFDIWKISIDIIICSLFWIYTTFRWQRKHTNYDTFRLRFAVHLIMTESLLNKNNRKKRFEIEMEIERQRVFMTMMIEFDLICFCKNTHEL